MQGKGRKAVPFEVQPGAPVRLIVTLTDGRKAEVVVKAQWPTTPSGIQLATEVRDDARTPSAVKARLIQEIMDHEDSHGLCTQTFMKKIRKQVRPKT